MKQPEKIRKIAFACCFLRSNSGSANTLARTLVCTTVKENLYIDRMELRPLAALREPRDRLASHLAVLATVFPSSTPHGV